MMTFGMAGKEARAKIKLPYIQNNETNWNKQNLSTKLCKIKLP